MSDQRLFWTATKIKPRNRNEIVSLRTGITKLDKDLIGLNKGEVTCVSGLNGSGKSSVLSQICLEVVQIGHKVALFSGELPEYRVLNWLQLQSAGKKFARGSVQYPNYFWLEDDVKQSINEWLDQKLFVYNNNVGKKTEKIFDALDDCIRVKGVDLVILDNLMSIDLDANSYNKNEKQSGFVQMVVDFAKQYNVHIILVAHPRKSIGFLRKDDIAGTADLTNAVDNVFIIHRVNEDFKRLTKQTFGWRTDSPIYDYDNVIEVCKNRDFGIQDQFYGLYYEKESKRFLNEVDEAKRYGWELEVKIDEPFSSPFDL
jgi:twinkle protein